jgi:hypothetical protein
MNEWQGKQKYSEKTCLSAALCTTDPTWFDPGLNPSRRGRKPETIRLSYGTTKFHSMFRIPENVSEQHKLILWENLVRYEFFMAVIIKNIVFGDVTPCGSCKNDVSE